MPIVIHIITPIITKGIRTLDDVASYASDEIEFRHSLLDKGPSSIESEYDEALAIPDTIQKAIEAENDGADAIVIDCMGDPGVKAVREVVSIPVFGPAETSMHAAAMLGQKYTIVTVLHSVVPLIHNLAKVYGTAEKLASIRVINMPVLELENDFKKAQRLIAQASLAAIKEDDADVIILGCTGFLGCAEKIKDLLVSNGLNIPVIDPIPLTVMTAVAFAKTGLRHSKKTYAQPRDKIIVGY